ncbi:BglG family transcription antiterminator [Oceanobacillus sp. CFH 90083]|uniref:BglG family transcription antiterminator n=1 Tax=Oceanobacillus sp. CFH 90083 TaxID=2592336 RepID=UPI00128CCC8E|nr:BglG family transcription antiterminator [Oceanobacillus sp. CFH 90083]
MELLNKRELKMLHLLSSSKEMHTGQEIALLLNVSSRTVRNDIKNVNVVLPKYHAEIISHKGKGYELIIRNEDKFRELLPKTDYAVHRRHTGDSESKQHVDEIVRKILMNCLHGEVIFQEELAESLFISATSLKKYLPLVRSAFKEYNLTLVSDKKNGFVIQGKEEKIRFCISDFLFQDEKFELLDDLFPNNFLDVDSLKDIVLSLLIQHQLRLTDDAIKNLIIHIIITVWRIQNHQESIVSKELQSAMEHTKEFTAAVDIIETIHKKMGINLKDEIYYLTQHLSASSRLSSQYIDTKEYDQIKQMLLEALHEIKDATAIDLIEDQQLINGLITHLVVAFKRIVYQMNIRNDALNSIKNSYPLAFQLAMTTSNYLTKSMKLTIHEDEIGYIAIHFGVALERKGLNHTTIKNILIVCGSGMATAALIKEKILRSYGDQVNIVNTMSLSEFKEDKADNVDLIITTIDIPFIDSRKLLKVNPIINHQDLITIRKKINTANQTLSIETYQYLFKKDLFIKSLNLETKEDVLHYLTKRMKDRNYISQTTIESIFEREKMASSELCSLLAIPHPLVYTTGRPCIAVGILSKPILWGKENVQVVVILCIPKHQQEQWEIIFKKLYRFLIEDYGITKLISDYNYDDFIRKLYQYEEFHV